MENQRPKSIQEVIEKIEEVLANSSESFSEDEKQSLKDAKDILEGVDEAGENSLAENAELALIVLRVVEVIVKIFSGS